MIEKTEGLSFVQNESTVWDRYTYFIEGRRVFDVLVDLSDATEAATEAGLAAPDGMTMHRLYVATVDALPSTALPTKGFAAKGPHFSGEGVYDHVDGKTVEQYIAPRRATMLARLFVPLA